MKITDQADPGTLKSVADHQDLPLTFVGMGFDHLQEPVERPSGIPIHNWLQVVEGSGEVIIDGQKAIARKGSGILLMAGTPHSYHAVQGYLKIHYILFGGLASLPILKSLHFDQSGIYHISNPENSARQLHEIAKLEYSTGNSRDLRLSKSIYAMLLDLSVGIRYSAEYQPAIPDEKLQIVIQFIEVHFNEPISLATLAELVNLRKEYLCTKFKQSMGQTISHFIQSIRIAHARIYLNQFPEKTIHEIALMCGFESSSYFCRVFRQFEKTSPQQYRLHL